MKRKKRKQAQNQNWAQEIGKYRDLLIQFPFFKTIITRQKEATATGYACKTISNPPSPFATNPKLPAPSVHRSLLCHAFINEAIS
jgi:hypothetical protein